MKKKGKLTTKRILAYVIDIFIVTIISEMFANLDLINSTLSDYNDVYSEYYSFVSNYSNISNLTTNSVINDINYDLTYLSIPNSIISLIVILFYFVVFQYFNNGKTIGKAIMKLKINNIDKGNVSLLSLFLRYLLLGNIITGIASIILISYSSKNIYYDYCLYIEYIEMFVILITYGMFLFREDNRGLHDMIGNTIVVSTESELKYIKEVNNKEE